MQAGLLGLPYIIIPNTRPDRTHSYRHTVLSDISNRIVGKILLCAIWCHVLFFFRFGFPCIFQASLVISLYIFQASRSTESQAFPRVAVDFALSCDNARDDFYLPTSEPLQWKYHTADEEIRYTENALLNMIVFIHIVHIFVYIACIV